MKKTMVRIVCIVLVTLMVATIFTGVIGSLIGYAVDKEIPVENSSVIFRQQEDNAVIKYLSTGTTYNLVFTYTETTKSIIDIVDQGGKVSIYSLDNDDRINWQKSGNTRNMSVSIVSKENDNSSAVFRVIINGIAKTGKNNRYLTTIANLNNKDGSDSGQRIEYSLFVPDSYFNKEISKTDAEKAEELKSDSVLENVSITDKDGNRIDEVTKDTKPFNLTITYLEYGLETVDLNDMADRDYSVFLKTAGGFYSDKGTRGELTKMASSSDGTPRFKAVFKNLTYDEKLGNVIALTMKYGIDESSISGLLDVTVKQAKVKEKDEDDKIGSLKPYIIIDSFSYGNQDIVAGSEFSLNINYTNTSTDIPLENIVMTVTIEKELSIASSSNTVYVPALPAKASKTHLINLVAKPNAEIGSAEITVDFTYQYLDPVTEKREEGKFTEKIGIPITQIDRFAIDPITELADMAYAGEPFFVTISFINRGKSPTYNISATVKSDQEFVSAGQHFGNLEPGKSDSIEMTITTKNAGEFVGEIVVQYEDENSNQKELSSPFSISVEEMPNYEEENFTPPDVDAPPPSTPTLTIVFSVLGALFVAAPIAYYFVKRNKAKDSEVFDEDF